MPSEGSINIVVPTPKRPCIVCGKQTATNITGPEKVEFHVCCECYVKGLRWMVLKAQGRDE